MRTVHVQRPHPNRLRTQRNQPFYHWRVSVLVASRSVARGLNRVVGLTLFVGCSDVRSVWNGNSHPLVRLPPRGNRPSGVHGVLNLRMNRTNRMTQMTRSTCRCLIGVCPIRASTSNLLRYLVPRVNQIATPLQVFRVARTLGLLLGRRTLVTSLLLDVGKRVLLRLYTVPLPTILPLHLLYSRLLPNILRPSSVLHLTYELQLSVLACLSVPLEPSVRPHCSMHWIQLTYNLYRPATQRNPRRRSPLANHHVLSPGLHLPNQHQFHPDKPRLNLKSYRTRRRTTCGNDPPILHAKSPRHHCVVVPSTDRPHPLWSIWLRPMMMIDGILALCDPNCSGLSWVHLSPRLQSR